MSSRQILHASSVLLLALSCGNLIGIGDLSSSTGEARDGHSGGSGGAAGKPSTPAGSGGTQKTSGGALNTGAIGTTSGGTIGSGIGGGGNSSLTVGGVRSFGGLLAEAGGSAGGADFAGGTSAASPDGGSWGSAGTTSGGASWGGTSLIGSTGGVSTGGVDGGSNSAGGWASGGVPVGGGPTSAGGIANSTTAGRQGAGGTADSGAAGVSGGPVAGQAGKSGTTITYSLAKDLIATACGANSTSWRLMSSQRVPIARSKQLESLLPSEEMSRCMLSADTNGAPFSTWTPSNQDYPNAIFNLSSAGLTQGPSVIPPSSMTLHPGASLEYSSVVWVAPSAGSASVVATFAGLFEQTSVDVCVLLRGAPLYTQGINNLPTLRIGAGWSGTLNDLAAGDTLEFAVGPGSDNAYYSDATLVDVTIVFTSS